MLLPRKMLGEVKPPPSVQSQAGEELAGAVHSRDYSGHHFHTLCGTRGSVSPWLGLPRLTGTVVSTLGWPQLVMGQLLGDTDCWP